MDKLNNEISTPDLNEQGYAYIKEILNADTCSKLKEKINKRLQEFIHFHACSEQEYFSAINRWPLSSVIDAELLQDLITQLTPLVSQMYGVELQPYEMDVLYKSTFADLGTPCHQDIAYARKRPYHASTWIALTKVTPMDSPLQVLPGSHQKPILPAIDFWQPNFIDAFRQTDEWQQQAITFSANVGDSVIFSSRLWHGSLKHQSLQPRLTIAIRWGNEALSYEAIPLPSPTKFGIWNCGEFTQTLLQQGLKDIYGLQPSNFLAAIQAWEEFVVSKQLPFQGNIQQMYIALKKLRLLNEGYQKYSGGDGQGIVYAKVWKEVLLPLQTYLDNKTN